MTVRLRINPTWAPSRKEKEDMKWLLDFINADLENLPYGDLVKFQFEFACFCRGFSGIRNTVEADWEKMPEHIPTDVLRNYQEEGRNLLDSLLSLIRRDSKEKHTEKRGLVRSDFFSEVEPENYSAILDIQLITTPVLSSIPSHEFARIYLRHGPSPDAADLERFPHEFRHSFFKSISSFNLFDIRRCAREDCDNFFLKVTAKEKNFCSNRLYFSVSGGFSTL